MQKRMMWMVVLGLVVFGTADVAQAKRKPACNVPKEEFIPAGAQKVHKKMGEEFPWLVREGEWTATGKQGVYSVMYIPENDAVEVATVEVVAKKTGEVIVVSEWAKNDPDFLMCWSGKKK